MYTTVHVERHELSLPVEDEEHTGMKPRHASFDWCVHADGMPHLAVSCTVAIVCSRVGRDITWS